MKTGDFRSVFWPVGNRVVVVRVLNRRDLERELGAIDFRALVAWVRQQTERG